MQVIYYNLAALAIAMLYYLWRDQCVIRVNRQRQLRERVAYMLWCAAQRVT